MKTFGKGMECICFTLPNSGVNCGCKNGLCNSFWPFEEDALPSFLCLPKSRYMNWSTLGVNQSMKDCFLD